MLVFGRDEPVDGRDRRVQFPLRVDQTIERGRRFVQRDGTGRFFSGRRRLNPGNRLLHDGNRGSFGRREQWRAREPLGHQRRRESLDWRDLDRLGLGRPFGGRRFNQVDGHWRLRLVVDQRDRPGGLHRLDDRFLGAWRVREHRLRDDRFHGGRRLDFPFRSGRRFVRGARCAVPASQGVIELFPADRRRPDIIDRCFDQRLLIRVPFRQRDDRNRAAHAEALPDRGEVASQIGPAPDIEDDAFVAVLAEQVQGVIEAGGRVGGQAALIEELRHGRHLADRDQQRPAGSRRGAEARQHLIDPVDREGLGVAGFGQRMPGHQRRRPTVRAGQPHGQQGLPDFLTRHRAAEIGGKPGMPELLAFAGTPDRGDHHQRHLCECRVGLEPGGDLGVHRPHRVVGEHAGAVRVADRRAFAEFVDHLVDVVHKGDIPAGRIELFDEPRAAGRIRFDDQGPATRGGAGGFGRVGVSWVGDHQRQGEPEPAPLPGRALGADFATHQSDQFGRQAEPQPGNAEGAIGRGIDRDVLVEHPLEPSGGHADPGVLDHKPDPGVFAVFAVALDPDDDFTLAGAVDRVADEVPEHLAGPAGVADDVPGQFGPEVDPEGQAPFGCPRRQDAGRFLDHRLEIERNRFDDQPRRGDPGQIEDVVEDRAEAFAGGVNAPDVLTLLGGEVAVEQEAGHADHAVQRGPELVAHGQQIVGHSRPLGGRARTMGCRRHVAVDVSHGHGFRQAPIRALISWSSTRWARSHSLRSVAAIAIASAPPADRARSH